MNEWRFGWELPRWAAGDGGHVLSPRPRCMTRGPAACWPRKSVGGAVPTPAVGGRHVTPGGGDGEVLARRVQVSAAAARGTTDGSYGARLSPECGTRGTSGRRVVYACGPTAVESLIACGRDKCFV